MRTSRLRVLLPAALAVAALLVAACGSSSSATNGSAADQSASSSAPSGLDAFRECMAGQGVTLPDRGQNGQGGGPPPGAQGGGPPPGAQNGAPPPGGGVPGGQLPDGVTQEQFDAARQACQNELPQGGQAGPGGGPDASATQAFRSCLQDHNVTESGQSPPNMSDPTVQAAMQACAPLMPQGGPGGPGGPGAGGGGGGTPATTAPAAPSL